MFTIKLYKSRSSGSVHDSKTESLCHAISCPKFTTKETTDGVVITAFSTLLSDESIDIHQYEYDSCHIEAPSGKTIASYAKEKQCK